MAARDSDSGRVDDWMQELYHHHSVAVSEPIAITSTAATVAAPVLQPERRVAKPVRRRSRASRKAPTRVVNTDPTNFRAMVQQFTGVANPPTYPTIYQPSPAYATAGVPQFRIEQATHDRPVDVPFGGQRQLEAHDVATGFLQGFDGSHGMDGSMSNNNAWF